MSNIGPLPPVPQDAVAYIEFACTLLFAITALYALTIAYNRWRANDSVAQWAAIIWCMTAVAAGALVFSHAELVMFGAAGAAEALQKQYDALCYALSLVGACSGWIALSRKRVA